MLSVVPCHFSATLNFNFSLRSLSQAAKACSNRFLAPAVGRRIKAEVVVIGSHRSFHELATKSEWSSGSSRAPICEVPNLRRSFPVCDVGMADVEAEDVTQVGARGGKKSAPLELGSFSIEGISIGGHETCVMVPGMRMAFDIGRCPQRAIAQDFLFISHAHMDHIGGIAMYVATRGLYQMKPPTIFVPKCVKATVEKLIEVYRELDGSELALRLVGLDIGEEYDLGKGYLVKPFRTYHVVPSQGYVIYSVKKKLKPEYMHLPGPEIKLLRLSGVEIVNIFKVPEVAFTGDTTADFIVDEANKDALEAKLLIMECRQHLLMTQCRWSMHGTMAMFICLRSRHLLINSRITIFSSFTFRLAMRHGKFQGRLKICQKHLRAELLRCWRVFEVVPTQHVQSPTCDALI